MARAIYREVPKSYVFTLFINDGVLIAVKLCVKLKNN